MSKKRDMIGKKFGRLLVIEEAETYRYAPDKKHPNGNNARQFKVRCECGNEKKVIGCNITSGKVQSCGCLNKELAIKRSTKHGDASGGTKTAEWICWWAMIQRCENPNTLRYQDYGGRGIKVCSEWRESFTSFLEDMGRKPSREYSIDRVDNNRGYEPSNCQWKTSKEQAANRRSPKKPKPPS